MQWDGRESSGSGAGRRRSSAGEIVEVAGAELGKPLVALEQLVEREKVVVVDGRAAARLQGLGGNVHQHRHHATGKEQANDSLVGRLLYELRARGAREPVGVRSLTGRDAEQDVIGCEIYFSAVGARCLDCRHLSL